MNASSNEDFEKFLNVANEELALRLRAIRHCFAGSGRGAQSDFAKMIGVEMRRWNNYECGRPVPRDVGARIVFFCPGVTADWLWYGDWSSLRQKFAEELREKLADARQVSGRTRPRGDKRAVKSSSTTNKSLMIRTRR